VKYDKDIHTEILIMAIALSVIVIDVCYMLIKFAI